MIHQFKGDIMLDNKHLSLLVIQGLRSLAYEQQVKVFDKNCGQCPFAVYKTNIKNRLVKHQTSSEAIEKINFSEDDSAQIIRSCCFGGEDFSLFEIVSNTCRLWNKKTCESFEGIFEVQSEVESKVESIVYLEERFTFREVAE
jgi:hypothetical protein